MSATEEKTEIGNGKTAENEVKGTKRAAEVSCTFAKARFWVLARVLPMVPGNMPASSCNVVLACLFCSVIMLEWGTS